jgi:predicted extracellular nuclease
MPAGRRSVVVALLVAFLVPALPVTPVAPAAASSPDVVISEFRVRGPNGAADEFIELFNRSDAPVSIAGWTVRGSNASGTTGTRATIGAGVSIGPGCYYLLGNSSTSGGPYSGTVTPDLTFSTGITDDGGIAIVDAAAVVVDQVGMSAGSAYKEGTPLASLGSSNLDRGYERKPGGLAGAGQDTDDNSADFQLAAPSQPQGSTSACVGGPPPTDAAPTVVSTTPANGATNVPVGTTVSVTFSEPVTLESGAISLTCVPEGPAALVDSGPAMTFELVLVADLPQAAACTLSIIAARVHDADADDPPDTMVDDVIVSFSTFTPIVLSNEVAISQVYGGGGNAGTTYRNDFIELYNRGTTDVSLSGWSVQYAAATGTSWQVTPLTGTIPAGRHYLIQQAAGSGGTVDLPDPDDTGTIAMSATNGKVALVAATTALSGACPSGGTIRDLVGYGTANCFEGAGPVPALANTTAALRKDQGAIDTDDNAADFVLGDPTPRASKDSAPKVVSTVPSNGATGVPVWANLTITFSEPVTVADSWYSIVCATSGSHLATVSGGPARFVLDPVRLFDSDETCTVTISAAHVSDVDDDDPPDAPAGDHVFTFTVAPDITCGDPATFIHEVQGSGPSSPLVGDVVEIEGVVVGAYPGTAGLSGLHVQEEDPDQDGDAATSEGIFVFEPNGGASYAVGDLVRAKGRVVEFATGGVTLTELTQLSNLVVCGDGPTVTPTTVSLPFASPDAAERYEGMLVTFVEDLTVTETFGLGRFGEVVLSSGGRLFTPTNITSPGAAAVALQVANDLRRIVLDDGLSGQNLDPTLYPDGGLAAANTLRVGDVASGGTFVLEQRFGTYRLQPTADLPAWSSTNPRPVAPEPVGGHVRVASFNVLNYFDGDGEGGGFPTARGASSVFEFQRQRAKTISAIVALDAHIVGLMELENDAGARSAIADLVSGLDEATAPGTYAFIDTGVVGTDEIRVGLLYQPAVVSPVGAHAILTSAVDPRFDESRNRPTIAQTFERVTTGARVTVAVNHLKSKGSACAGDPATGDGQGNCNLTRTAAAEALADWLASDPTGSGSPHSLIIGDLNAYAREDPIAALEAAGYVNLLALYHGDAAYSYVFGGQSGYLDHALASPSLLAEVTGATEWHINADEPPVLDYDVDFKSDGHVETLYAPDPFRSSDHDPVLVGLALAGSPTADAGGPYVVVEGGTATVSATGSEPDGGALTFAWDLDGDGIFETAGATATVSAAGLEAPGSFSVTVRATGPTGRTATDTAVVDVIWDFGGFYGPIRSRPALNDVTAGAMVVLKFALAGDQGMDILESGYPASAQFACGTAPPQDASQPTAGQGLQFDPATGLYSYLWKTDKAWAGTCRTFVLTLVDGTSHVADMRFRG